MTPTITPRAKSAIRLIVLLLMAFGWASFAQAQSYTISPPPFLLAQNNSGAIINNACIWTYSAGTTTAATTYSDNIGTPNANPIRSDPAGRFTAYLVAGSNYKFVYEAACTPPAHGTVLRTADNIAGVPASAATVDITGTAGETLSAGQCAYLSDGSASKTSGQWFKCDTSNPYSSTLPVVGMTPSAILSAASGTIRISGSVSGLSSLSVGSTYYVGATGAVTSTAPALRRVLGVADSSTSLVLKDSGVQTQPWVNDFRLTLTTAVPVTNTDVTAATTIFESPYIGNRMDLPDASCNPQRVTTAEFSIAVPATTSQMYDVFAFLNGSTATLELLAWTNDTTRATALVRTNGRLFKTGDCTRMYVGSFRTTTVSGQTEDSLTKRYVWNYYNRVLRALQRYETTATWTYSSATIRQANGSPSNQVDIVQGVIESPISLTVNEAISQATGGALVMFGLAQDSTTTFGKSVSVDTRGGAQLLANIFHNSVQWTFFLSSAGRHVVSWNEQNSSAVITTTWQGTSVSATIGIDGWEWG